MHFALPSKTSIRGTPFLPSPSTRTTFISTARRRPYISAAATLSLLFLLWRLLFAGAEVRDGPDTVVVVVTNHSGWPDDIVRKVVENRREYADLHGYGLFHRDTTDYPSGGHGWSRIPALRAAMSSFPSASWFFYLDQNAIIMNPSLCLHSHILNAPRLTSLLRRDVPVVPPDSVIRTYKFVPAHRLQLVLTQDHEGLQSGSMLVKRGEWARYFLDSWYDPMFRFYSWAKREQHALEHIVQWHPTILTKLGLIPQRIMNSYPNPPGSEGAYEEGDFVIHFHECEKPERSCEKEFRRYWEQRGGVDT